MKEHDKLKKLWLTDSSSSDWLKAAIKELDERDVEDVLGDIESLTQIFEEKWKELTLRKADDESRLCKL